MLCVALHLEGIAPLAAKQFDRRFVGWELVGGQQIDGVDFFQRALGVRVKQAQTVNFIVEEIQTIGLFAAHRVQIQQRAAGSVFAMFHDLINMPVTSAVEL